jgi:hypothetical protein
MKSRVSLLSVVLIVIFLIGCTGVDRGGGNRPPKIDSFSPQERSLNVLVGESKTFTVTASDPDEDSLGYVWIQTGNGQFVSKNEATVIWQAPNEAGQATVEVSVSDGKDGTVLHKWDINVADIEVPDPNTEKFKVILYASPADGGSIVGAGTYEAGAIANITAVPNTGWRFDHWEGDLEGDDNPATVVVDGEKSVTAVFIRTDFSLDIVVQGQGHVMVGGNSLPTSSGRYNPGASVELSAIPAEGWYFARWEGDLQGTTNPKVITMDDDKSIVAIFNKEFLELEKPYLAADGLTVILHDFSVVEKSGSYQYSILYTLQNNTVDQKIGEGTFKLFRADGEGGVQQYGFFDYLFPGDSRTRAYYFEELKSDIFVLLQYHHDNFFLSNPVDEGLHWEVQY